MFSAKTFAEKPACVRTAPVCTRMKETITLLGMAGLLFWPACQAQVRIAQQQSSATGQGTSVASFGIEGEGSAAKFRERLLSACKSGKTQCVGRTGPKIVNPQAEKVAGGPIWSVLGNQKQNAGRETEEMRASFGFPISQPSGAGNRPMQAKGANTAGSSNAISGEGGRATTTSQNSTVPIVQRTGAPQGALKTESASGSPSPGSAAQANVAMHPCPQPNVSTISGFATVVFTPIPLFNPYTIKGCGFGNQMGNVYLTGPFYAGKIKLTVQTSAGGRGAPPRPSWSDTAIVVSVDPQVSGELNQENVTLVVEPVGGAPIQKAGNKFLASAEDVTLLTIPQSAVTFFDAVSASAGGKTTTKTINSGSTATAVSVTSPDLLYYTPSQAPAGLSAEVFRGGKTTSFFSAGSDLFDFSGLAPGFVPESFQLYPGADPTGCDQGTGGSEGSWNAAWDGQNIRVIWKEFQCHNMWTGNLPEVWSNYALSVVAKGPRGIDPWTGKRLLSVSPVRALAR